MQCSSFHNTDHFMQWSIWWRLDANCLLFAFRVLMFAFECLKGRVTAVSCLEGIQHTVCLLLILVILCMQLLIYIMQPTAVQPYGSTACAACSLSVAASDMPVRVYRPSTTIPTVDRVSRTEAAEYMQPPF